MARGTRVRHFHRYTMHRREGVEWTDKRRGEGSVVVKAAAAAAAATKRVSITRAPGTRGYRGNDATPPLCRPLHENPSSRGQGSSRVLRTTICHPFRNHGFSDYRVHGGGERKGSGGRVE